MEILEILMNIVRAVSKGAQNRTIWLLRKCKMVSTLPIDNLSKKSWVSENDFELNRKMMEEVFNSYRRNGAEIERYFIAKGYNWASCYGVFPDAEFGLILLKETDGDPKTLASIWFDVLPYERIVFVKQIQGMRGMQEELKNFRWERMLLRFLVSWAKLCGAKYVYVICGEKQSYWRENRRQKFHLLYNITPKREGFLKGNEYSYFRLS